MTPVSARLTGEHLGLQGKEVAFFEMKWGLNHKPDAGFFQCWLNHFKTCKTMDGMASAIHLLTLKPEASPEGDIRKSK